MDTKELRLKLVEIVAIQVPAADSVIEVCKKYEAYILEEEKPTEDKQSHKADKVKTPADRTKARRKG